MPTLSGEEDQHLVAQSHNLLQTQGGRLITESIEKL